LSPLSILRPLSSPQSHTILVDKLLTAA
jgi:hypothetical protein